MGSPDIDYVHFDFHVHCKGTGLEGLALLDESVAIGCESMGFTDWLAEGGVLRTQSGVYRVNCMDCLDRTNVAQWRITRLMLLNMLKVTRGGVRERAVTGPQAWGCAAPESKWDTLGAIEVRGGWGELSVTAAVHRAADVGGQRRLPVAAVLRHRVAEGRHHTVRVGALWGTGSTSCSTGKRSLEGLVNDGVKSLRRFYLSRFRDETRQDMIDFLLGHFQIEAPVAEQGEAMVATGEGRRRGAASLTVPDNSVHVDVTRILRTGAQRKASIDIDFANKTVR